MNETMKLSEPGYRLFRRMDGEIVLQYFIHFSHDDGEGYWEDLETINEGQNGITSSNAS